MPLSRGGRGLAAERRWRAGLKGPALSLAERSPRGHGDWPAGRGPRADWLSRGGGSAGLWPPRGAIAGGGEGGGAKRETPRDPPGTPRNSAWSWTEPPPGRSCSTCPSFPTAPGLGIFLPSPQKRSEFPSFLLVLWPNLEPGMSKKQNTKDPSGFIFDVQSNTVMAQGGTFENMKEKIGAVRAIVPNRSNNEIVLVLQHFDNCVDKTVQAFMEGNASDVLKEWTVTGKKKNKKKKPKPKLPSGSSSALPAPGKPVPPGEETPGNWEKGGMNGFHMNGCAQDTESVDSLSEGLDGMSMDGREVDEPGLRNGLSGPDPPRRPPPPPPRALPPPHSDPREEAPVSPPGRKMGSNIEKSVKDLQRCSVSLARYRALLKEEMDTSIRKMKQVFAELQSSLMDREVALLAEMDKVKAEAMEILVGRQRRAEALRKLTDGAARMSEEQLLELRADIKHFVSERKYDEELGRAGRFTCDLEGLKRSITCFGQVSHPKTSYSSRSRCSSGPPGAPPGPPSASPTPSTAGKAPGPPEGALGDTGGGRPRPPPRAFPADPEGRRRTPSPDPAAQRPPRAPQQRDPARPPQPSDPRPPHSPPGGAPPTETPQEPPQGSEFLRKTLGS
ncbi:spermatogenesis-associated serine-rich protein 2 isoform X2 [Corapipo altera]|uniref:spermatogenesis-associated serine-rich protein 2 isoform X2 n=1 Tax=Corapipo altera TaxID=415028 RepID=UPI000FD6ABD5|nr:spermatogenesis-associated serine-rich protein 2 isoform X2 [Corapipo altera]